YLQQNSDVKAAVEGGQFRSAWQHFSLHGQHENRAPSVLFDPAFYLAQNPDVKTAIANEEITSAIAHFMIFGQFENRAPSKTFNPAFYLNQNPDVKAAVESGQFESGWQHYVLHGLEEGRPGADLATPTASLAITNITSNGAVHTFTVTYADDVAVQVGSLDSSDLRVTGPDGFDQLATLVSVDSNSDGTPRTATYQITAPGGAWDTADNGSYSVTLQANQVNDDSNNFVAGGVLGTFEAKIAPVAPPPNNFAPIRLEAESMQLNTFRVEPISSASQGNVISLVVQGGTETGTASFAFNGPSGLYDMVVSYYDESDGKSTGSIRRQGTVLGTWTFDQNRGDGGAIAQTRARKTIASNVTVTQGETFQIQAQENSGEPARIDYIEFVPRTPGTINGTNSSEILIGDAKDNVLNGFGGNDILRGGLGNDQLNGGDGSDTADYSQVKQGVIANLSTGTTLAPLFGTTLPRIMPLGDSITEGLHQVSPRPGAYRIKLWQDFTENGLSVNFVGAQNNGPNELGDKDHEGHGGWSIDQIRDLVNGGALSNHPSDMVLLMIGSNDANSTRSTLKGMYDDLSELIDRITALAPNTQLLVSSIAPMNPAVKGSRATKVQEFNALIPDLVNDKIEQGKNVRFVNAGGSLSVSDLVSDGLHPNSAGYDKLGDAWYNGIVERDTLTGIENLIGSSFSDRLTGNAGNNFIEGGLGGDTLTGTGGADIYVYRSPAEGADTITDWSSDDLFYISAAGFGGGLKAGIALGTPNSTGVFVSNTAPTSIGSSANFLYNTSNGLLSFDSDGTGGSAAVAIATLQGAPTLRADQFQIIA
ncbi:MAG TPA: GDSL-type esterase/lipase family protein, partial [Allocoleopsis sp.]